MFNSSFIRIVFSMTAIACAASHDVYEEPTCLNVALWERTYTSYVTLNRNSSLCVFVETYTMDVRYYILQVHSHKFNLSLSYVNKANSTGNAISGTSLGLVSNSLINKSVKDMFWIFNQGLQNVTFLLSVVGYEEKDPIPGGCNMEFPIKISPFMRLYYNRISTRLQFQLANVGYPSEMLPPLCSNSSLYLSYQLYVYYLPEGDFSQSSMFEALRLMQNVSSIMANAFKVKSYNTAPATQRTLISYPGQGTIYNIIVHDKNSATSYAAYVPISTYGCSFDSSFDTCEHLNSSFAKVFTLVISIIGFGVCVKGHRYFTLEMAFFGFLALSLISFISVERLTYLSTSDRDVITIAVGVIGAAVWALLWWFFGIPVISVLLVGFVLGFLLTAVIFFTPFGNCEVLRNNLNYWMIISSGMLIVPILLLPFTRLLNILGSAVVGSYASLMVIDRYIKTTLSYIVLNVVRRAIDDDLYQATNSVPFQRNDIILSVVWALLAAVGFAFQYYTEYRRAPFPPTPYKVWKQNRQQHRQRVQRHLSRNREVAQVVANERTPLLGSQSSTLSASNSSRYTVNFMGTI